MSNFVKIYIYSFISFIALSLAWNLLLPGLYAWPFIFLLYLVLLVGITCYISFQDLYRVLGFFLWIAFLGYIVLYPIKDGSWDGSSYHLEIIWNFIHGYSFVSTKTLDLWSHVYPKNQEILLSIFASIDQWYIDMGRVIKFVLMGITILSVYHFTRRSYPHLRTYWTIFIFLGILFHPLILSQVFTKYIDDMLYMFFILYVISFLSWEYVISLLLFALFVGSKLNYVIYIGVSFPLLVIIASKLKHIDWKDILREARSIFLQKKVYSVWILLISFIIASYIYWINIYNYHNPVYPLLWTNSIEVVSNNLPANLVHVPKPIAHFYSFFSYSLSDFTQNAYLINPFASDFWELSLRSYRNIEVDTRMSGFGSLWSIVFFITILHSIFLFFFSKKYRCILLSIFLTSFAILIFMPFAWARFIPFFYLFPFLISIWLRWKYRKYYTIFILSIFILNTVLYVGSYYGRYYFHNSIQNVITEYYLKRNALEIIWYYPWKNQDTKKMRISDMTQNELYHLKYEIPVIWSDEISSHCSENNIDELFNIWSGLFDVLTPLVVECDNDYRLVRTRGYIYHDFFLAKRTIH